MLRTWKLKRKDPEEVEMIPCVNTFVKAKIIEVHDGDTCKVIYRYGSKYFKTSIRILGIDTPETTRCSDIEKEAGLSVRDYVRSLILGKIKYIKIEKNDKFGGRVLGDVYLHGKQKPLSQHLLQRNVAKPYHGEKKEAWTDKQCKNIVLRLTT